MNNRNQNKIELSKEQEAKAINEIMNYFEKERDEELGNMEALLILSFFLEKVGPLVYNCAVTDAEKLMQKKSEELYDLIMWDWF